MPSAPPPAPLSFDFAAAADLVAACTAAAATLEEAGRTRAAALEHVADWEGPRRDSFLAGERLVELRWADVVDELRRAAAAVNARCDWARHELRRREEEQIRWELEAAAEREALARAAARDAEARAAADQEAAREAVRRGAGAQQRGGDAPDVTRR